MYTVYLKNGQYAVTQTIGGKVFMMFATGNAITLEDLLKLLPEATVKTTGPMPYFENGIVVFCG